MLWVQGKILCKTPKGGDIMMHLNISQGVCVAGAGRQRWGQEMRIDRQSGLGSRRPSEPG